MKFLDSSFLMRNWDAYLQNQLKLILPLVSHVFRVYDTNKDGTIDFKEYMIIAYTMMNGSPEERLNLMFPIFDTNNDGLVSYEEIYVIGKDNTNIMKDKFNSLLCLC